MKYLEKFPVFLLLLSLCMVMFILFLKEIKKAETSIVSEWEKVRYLTYLIQNKAPLPKEITLDKLKILLQKQGFEPELVEKSELGGFEMRITLSWKELGKLLKLLASNDFSILSFNAEISPEEKIFRVKMVLK